ncbi:MAG: cellulase family glycosylhydrolase [Bryobacterales bacterium]|nr:cellulase family glycosylhydrolase [Bryobacterales bacterium]
MLVLFDSVWDPHPKLGPQRAPRPGVHNSGWVQGPGADALADPRQQARLEAYVTGVVRAFANDERVLAWDLWNEPDNKVSQYGNGKVVPPNKIELVTAMMPKVFAWARAAKPSQPLTVGVWQNAWGDDAKLTPIEKIQLHESDVISFHDYSAPEVFEARIRSLERFGRPILCTEYMARGNQSTFAGSLPIARKRRVAAYNWGLVQGKTQTHLPWDSWQRPYVNGHQPAVWFHEVFRPDGNPYKANEVELIRKLTR